MPKNNRHWLSGRHDFMTPLFMFSDQPYYDPSTDTVYAPNTKGEFYKHEMFHARPNMKLLQDLLPYYDKLNDDKLRQLGADLNFVNRTGDPNQYYSPEELGARVQASLSQINGMEGITPEWIESIRKNENQYGDNFRDLLRMYNNINLSKILNIGRKYYK